MPPTRSHLREAVDTYLDRHPGERAALELLTALDSPGDPCDRATLSGHVTCSAVVIDRDRRVLHIAHKATGLLLAPGGHVEADDRSLMGAALRELREETGIQPGALCLTPQFLGTPLDIDVHTIDANPAKGEPAHRHYDFRYAFYLVADQPPVLELQEDEVSGALWRPFAEVTSPTVRAKLLNSGLDGRPEPVNASVLIHDGRGRYLLHLRDHHDGIWEPGAFALLGGGREPGDASLEATLRRELAEETPGLEVVDLKPYAQEEATSVEGLSVPIQVYSGRWNGDPDAVDLREGVLLRWFAPDLLDRLRLSPDTRALIRRHAAEHVPADTARPSDGTELHVVGVHLHLEDDQGRLLLGLRHPDSAYAGNVWHYLAGHCERESAVSCLVREAEEEAGLIIDPADVEFVHAVHVVGSPGARPRMQLVFRARSWTGTPKVLEPDRCVEWRWWAPRELPTEIVPYARVAIEGVLAGRVYSESGWGEA
ncbi:NUDIX domain-containing protein [Streptomyces sp. NPDC052051]|uniref:NUDIX domain-containing protein n=1 Tax=Streptomyces sp. NPDC052051 TaxID=3154649 RepID=UPI00341EBDEB